MQALFREFDDGAISVLSCPCGSPNMRLGDVLTPLASNSRKIDFAFDPIASLGISGPGLDPSASLAAVNKFLSESSISDMNECLASIDATRFKSELGSALSKADLLASPLELQLAQLLALESAQPGFDYSARRAYHLTNTFANFPFVALKSAMVDRLASTSTDALVTSLAKSVCEFAFGIDSAASALPKMEWVTRTCTNPFGYGGIPLVPGRLAGAAEASSGAHNFAYLQAQRKSKFAMEMSGVISSLRQFAYEFRDSAPSAAFVTQSAVSRRELEQLVKDAVYQQLDSAGARGDVLVPGSISGDTTLFETDRKFHSPAPPLSTRLLNSPPPIPSSCPLQLPVCMQSIPRGFSRMKSSKEPLCSPPCSLLGVPTLAPPFSLGGRNRICALAMAVLAFSISWT